MPTPVDRAALHTLVSDVLATTPITDIHTHLFAPSFGELLLWGLDELLTYHYLVAEAFRAADDGMDYARYWSLPKTTQAEWVWEHLFRRRSPISEAGRGVLTCLQALGCDPAERDLQRLRAAFPTDGTAAQIERVLTLSRVSTLVMTNDPFDAQERALWQRNPARDERFHAALRLDRLLVDWAGAGATLTELGYTVQTDATGRTRDEVARFVRDWIARTRPVYLAVSLPPEFTCPAPTHASTMLTEVLLPVAREAGLPVALMLGCRKLVNPRSAAPT